MPVDSSDRGSELAYRIERRQYGRDINIGRHKLKLIEDLGSGQFGAVKRAIYREGTTEVNVAVKMLKPDVNKEGSSQVSRLHHYDNVLSSRGQDTRKQQNRTKTQHPHLTKEGKFCTVDTCQGFLYSGLQQARSMHNRAYANMLEKAFACP